jgi:hypothetical protein
MDFRIYGDKIEKIKNIKITNRRDQGDTERTNFLLFLECWQ